MSNLPRSNCHVMNCASNDDDSYIPSFNLPLNVELRDKWVRSLRKYVKSTTPLNFLFRICYLHFDPDEINTERALNGKVTYSLKPNVIPKYFLSNADLFDTKNKRQRKRTSSQKRPQALPHVNECEKCIKPDKEKEELLEKVAELEKQITKRIHEIHLYKRRITRMGYVAPANAPELTEECTVCCIELPIKEMHGHLCIENLSYIKCEYCPGCFKTSQQLIHHLELNHTTQLISYDCKHCDKSFSMIELFNIHKQAHPDEEEPDFICEFEQCNEAFYSQLYLNQHILQEHSNLQESLILTPFKCGSCHQCFQRGKLLEAHIRSEHQSKGFKTIHTDNETNATVAAATEKISNDNNKNKATAQPTEINKSYQCQSTTAKETNATIAAASKILSNDNDKNKATAQPTEISKSYQRQSTTAKETNATIAAASKILSNDNDKNKATAQPTMAGLQRIHTNKEVNAMVSAATEKLSNDNNKNKTPTQLTIKVNNVYKRPANGFKSYYYCACKLRFELKEEFINHKKTECQQLNKSPPIKKIKIENSEPTLFSCDECRMCFVSEEQSNEHNKVAHSIKNTTVSSTATKKKTKIRTSNINRDKQRIMIEPSPTLKLFKCGTCGECFSIARELSTHVKNQHEKPTFTSVPITKGSSEKSNKKVEEKEEFQLCEECGEVFIAKGQLARHKRKHEAEVFRCEDCPERRFSSKKLYESHIINFCHRYKCDKCTKFFYRKDRYLRHIKTHLLEK